MKYHINFFNNKFKILWKKLIKRKKILFRSNKKEMLQLFSQLINKQQYIYKNINQYKSKNDNDNDNPTITSPISPQRNIIQLLGLIHNTNKLSQVQKSENEGSNNLPSLFPIILDDYLGTTEDKWVYLGYKDKRILTTKTEFKMYNTEGENFEITMKKKKIYTLDYVFSLSDESNFKKYLKNYISKLDETELFYKLLIQLVDNELDNKEFHNFMHTYKKYPYLMVSIISFINHDVKIQVMSLLIKEGILNEKYMLSILQNIKVILDEIVNKSSELYNIIEYDLSEHINRLITELNTKDQLYKEIKTLTLHNELSTELVGKKAVTNIIKI